MCIMCNVHIKKLISTNSGVIWNPQARSYIVAGGRVVIGGHTH